MHVAAAAAGRAQPGGTLVAGWRGRSATCGELVGWNAAAPTPDTHLALRLELVDDCVDRVELLAEVVDDVLGLLTLTTQDVDLAVNLSGDGRQADAAAERVSGQASAV